MKQASQEVTKAINAVDNVGIALKQIVEAFQKVKEQITHIATALEEQSAAAEDIVKHIEKTQSIADEVEKMADDVPHQSTILTELSENTRSLTGSFKTKSTELMIIDLAKTDHKIFISKRAACLKGDIRLDPNQLPDHLNCRFGKWNFSEGQ